MGTGMGGYYWSLQNVLWCSVQVHCITNKELNDTVVTRIRVPFWEFLLYLIKIIQKQTQKESRDIFIGVWEKKTTRQTSCKSQQWLGEGSLRRESCLLSRGSKSFICYRENIVFRENRKNAPGVGVLTGHQGKDRVGKGELAFELEIRKE